MQKLKTTLFIIIILLLTAACSQQPHSGDTEPEKQPEPPNTPSENVNTYEEKGFNLSYPEDWELLSEEKVQGSITLRLQEKKNAAGQVVISYFPASAPTPGEALQKAETLLRSSLFNIQETFNTKEERIGGREIPIIYTRSGATETKSVQAAVITGEKGYLLVTLIVREEAEEYFAPIFRLILERMEVE